MVRRTRQVLFAAVLGLVALVSFAGSGHTWVHQSGFLPAPHALADELPPPSPK